MKKTVFTFCYICFLLFVGFAENKRHTMMYVSSEIVEVKEKASITSKSIATLIYATPVIVINDKKSWSQITLPDDNSVVGWVNTGTLTRKRIQPNEKKVSTNANELALAGKGFSTVLEEDLSNSDYDFESVDLIEMNSVPESITIEFIEEGSLFLGE